jgi:hypothetical protein
MADGAVSSNKLADDIINSLNEMEEAKAVNRQSQRVSMAPALYNAMATDQYAYACHMHNLLLYAQPLQKPRPTYKRKGWLPL